MKIQTSRLALAMVFLLFVALFAAGQAITFAWLSAFPERASQLDSLTFKFWAYAGLCVVLILVDLGLLIEIIRRKRKVSRGGTPRTG